MSNKLSKEVFDADLTLVDLEFILKGNKQVVNVTTTATESMALVDYLNRNDCGFKSYSKDVREQFNNKYCMLRDYHRKKDVLITYADIKCMTIPFFVDKGDEVEFKRLVIGK